MVPVAIRMPLLSRCRFTASSIAPPRSCSSSRCRKFKIVVSSGAGARPRSTPANRRSTGESYSTSSAAGSLRLNHWLEKVNPQHDAQPHRRTPVLALRTVRPHQRFQLRPRHHAVHLFQKLLPPRLLPISLEPALRRQRLLSHSPSCLHTQVNRTGCGAQSTSEVP
jgi:hypothetical protein